MILSNPILVRRIRRFRLYAALWIVALCSISVLKAADTTPYIYFYSYTEQAFVVQRADGSDRTVLANYRLLDRHTQIVGAGWSPSANWFTWMSQGAMGGQEPNNVYIVGRVDQQTQKVFSEDVAIISEVAWSPTEDLLVVRFGNTSAMVQNIVIYDPSSGRIVFQLIEPEPNAPVIEAVFTTSWSPDGSLLALIDRASRQLYLIERDSFEVKSPIPATGREVLPFWLDNEHLLYLNADDNDLIKRNVVTNDEIVYPLEDDLSVSRIIASLDGTHALVYTRNTDNQTQLWHLSTDDAGMSLIDRDASSSNFTECPQPSPVWNSDNQAHYADQASRLFVFDAVTGVAEPVSASQSSEVQCEVGIWDAQNNLVFTSYFPESRKSETYQYSPETNQRTRVESENAADTTSSTLLSISSQGDYAYKDFIVDASGEKFLLELLVTNPRFGSSLGIMDIRWHPTEDWFFIISTNIEDLHQINIANGDVSTQLELALCPFDSQSCFGWMP